eukprot:m.33506 g.33506  ORF g.33506 m.33506 type:complete len:199 (+) comp15252_c0_seq1:523-1119(+)
MGDSVSIGYTPYVASAVGNGTNVSLQHTPWDTRDGGADDTYFGLQCMDYFLKTPLHQPFQTAPKLCTVNFGLHDVVKASTPAGFQQYLSNIKAIFQDVQAVCDQLLWINTTPVPYSAEEDAQVVKQNEYVAAICDNMEIPAVDLHSKVIDICGPSPYYNCSISLNKKGSPNPHYTAQGYEYLTSFIAPVIDELLVERV